MSENGGRDTYTVRLNSRPGSTVTITPVSDTPGAATVSGALRFTTGNWNRTQRVTIIGVNNDAIDAGNRSATITHRITGDATYAALTAGNLEVTVIDDDRAGVTISETVLSVSENGGRGTYTVRLNSRPGSTVTITPVSSDTNVAMVSPRVLTFSPGAWNRPKQFTITGVNNNAIDAGNRSATITHTVSGDATYAALTAGNLEVRVIDDDSAGVTISETVLSVSENGGMSTYTVRLNSRPGSTVTITPVSSDTNVATVSRPLTFSPGAWNRPKSVTVTGVNNDAIDAGNRSATIRHRITGDATYAALTAGNLEVTVIDDDSAGVTISDDTLSVGENGGRSSYTVRLNSRPGSTVTITPVSSDTNVARVSPRVLTFSPGAWNRPKSVTVTGVNNNTIDAGNRSATITHRITGDATYAALTAGSLEVTVIDDDRAGVTISEEMLSVSENGGRGSYTVRLNSRPGSTVTITSVSNDTNVAMVSPRVLTFSPGAWNRPKSVTVTGVNNNTIDAGNRSATITHRITGDAAYAALTAGNLEVTVIDDDRAGVTISETVLSVSENGGRGTYTVRLNSQPGSEVTITPVSDTPGAATVSRALRFTTGNWNRTQRVTVTGVNNNAIDAGNRSATITHRITGDAVYAALTTGSLEVTVIDDDSAGVTISETVLSVSENGGRGTYTVRLNSQPGSEVTITPVSDTPGAASVSGALRFTTGNWNRTQRVTVTGVNNNAIDAGNRSATITHRITGDAIYAALTAGSLEVTVIDDDRAGVTISETVLSVSENGGTDTYTVRLNSQPASEVTITPSSSDTNVATVSRQLTFTTRNWNRPKRFTVTGVNNNIDDRTNRSATITHRITGDATYAALTDIGSLAVTVIDDDRAGVRISETVLNVGENGEMSTYTVRLNSQPGAEVTITPVSGTPGTATVSGALRFSTGNWNRTQRVTVTGVNNNIDDRTNRSATITHEITGDATYAALTDVGNLEVRAIDDDRAGVTISKTMLNVDENGGRSTYTVRLNSQPEAPVTITPSSSDTNVVTVSRALIFSTRSWNRPQLFTVTGVNNNIDDTTNRSATITHEITGDATYAALTIGSVTATAIDDEGPAVTISETARSVSENGGRSTYTLRLNSRPGSTVTVTPVSSDTNVATVSGPLTFGDRDWETPQQVTITGVNNNIDDTANRSATITHSVASPAADYNGLTGVGSVAVTVTETAGVTISETTISVSENGGTATYRVWLNTRPGAAVNIIPRSSNERVARVSRYLTFTPGTWNRPQSVIVTGVNNNDFDAGNRRATITHGSRRCNLRSPHRQ